MSDGLIELERRGWQALSTSAAAALAFYDEILDEEVVMLLPGGLMLDERRAILDSMAGPPWSSYELRDARAWHPTADTGIVVYGVTAVRGGGSPYEAVMSSVYVRRGDRWRLAFHQQTPL